MVIARSLCSLIISHRLYLFLTRCVLPICIENILRLFSNILLSLSHCSGYWVEIVKRGDHAKIDCDFNFSQTMLRIKDPKKSLAFYKALGMKVLVERHFDDFSLYFLASPTKDSSDGDDDPKARFHPVLELTHNHGTEDKDDFTHYNGNEEGRQGFGHIGFLVDE
jgi:lactoylglutathione lyase